MKYSDLKPGDIVKQYDDTTVTIISVQKDGKGPLSGDKKIIISYIDTRTGKIRYIVDWCKLWDVDSKTSVMLALAWRKLFSDL